MNMLQALEQATELFVLPEAVTRLKACMDDQASSIDDIAEIIAFDPGLSTQILRVANSAMYRFPRKIETVTKALQVIGNRAAYDLAIAYGITHAFSGVDGSVIDLDKFWEQSVSCGLLAKYFAESRRMRESERLFVTGLLHQIGELVMVQLAPEQTKRCNAFNVRVRPHELQSAILGFTYNELSSALIEQWGLPEGIYRPIQTLHATPFTAKEDDARIMQLCYQLALDNVNPEIYTQYSHISEELQQQLGVSHEDMEDALDITNLQCLNVISLFNPSAFMLY